MAKRKVLGKGLSALIPEGPGGQESHDEFFHCPIEWIDPNPYQPREDFSEAQLEQMVTSVREKGVLTPLLVTRSGNRYQLIAGERRWRACQRAGLDRVPVIVREVTPTESLELALIENIHRKDLNPIEEALAYRRLLDEIGITQEALAQRVGRDRSSVTNLLRLLTLPPAMQKDLIDGRISMGHARVLAGVKDAKEQRRLRDEVVARSLSVRQLERLVTRRAGRPDPKRRDEQLEGYMAALTDTLKRSLGTKVEIRRRGKRGRIVVHFYSDEELERLLERLS